MLFRGSKVIYLKHLGIYCFNITLIKIDRIRMKYFAQVVVGLIFLILTSCTSNNETNQPVHSKDYIYVGDFTQGLEGPAVLKNGDLYFVNPHKNGTIGRVNSSINKFEVFIDSLANGSVANGIRVGRDGQMYLADYVNHNVLKLNPETKEVVIFANDSLMNQPNDLAISSNGTLFASDPNWKEETGNIWKINTSGEITLLELAMGTTNGIEVGSGDSLLYVNESAQRKVWVYDLSGSGEISNKRLLIEFEDFGLDGMRCDVEGNLYIARYGKGVVAVVSPQGKLLYEVKLTANKPTNVAFGGSEGKTVYVTCQDRGYIETFEAEFVGRSYQLNKN